MTELKRRKRKKVTSPAVVIGCDPSSRKVAFFITGPSGIGWVYAKELRKGSQSYTPASAAAALEACEEALAVAGPLLADADRRYLFLEEPVVARGGVRSTLVQAYINGVVQAYFVSAQFDVRVTHISTWKSGIGVAGNAGKPQVYEAMASLYPADVRMCDGDGDLLDAAALARFGRQTVGGR